VGGILPSPDSSSIKGSPRRDEDLLQFFVSQDDLVAPIAYVYTCIWQKTYKGPRLDRRASVLPFSPSYPSTPPWVAALKKKIPYYPMLPCVQNSPLACSQGYYNHTLSLSDLKRYISLIYRISCNGFHCESSPLGPFLCSGHLVGTVHETWYARLLMQLQCSMGVDNGCVYDQSTIENLWLRTFKMLPWCIHFAKLCVYCQRHL